MDSTDQTAKKNSQDVFTNFIECLFRRTFLDCLEEGVLLYERVSDQFQQKKTRVLKKAQELLELIKTFENDQSIQTVKLLVLLIIFSALHKNLDAIFGFKAILDSYANLFKDLPLIQKIQSA